MPMDGRKIFYLIGALINAYIVYHVQIDRNQLWSGLAFNSALMVILETFQLLPNQLKEKVPDTIHTIYTVFAASIASLLLTTIFLPQIEDLLLWLLILFDSAINEYMKRKLYFCSIQLVQGALTFLLCLTILHEALVYAEFIPRYTIALIKCPGPDTVVVKEPIKKK